MQINRELDNIKAQIIKHYQHLSDREAFVTAEMVRNSYQDRARQYYISSGKPGTDPKPEPQPEPDSGDHQQGISDSEILEKTKCIPGFNNGKGYVRYYRVLDNDKVTVKTTDLKTDTAYKAGDIIRADELFEAYPELADTEIHFVNNLPKGTMGQELDGVVYISEDYLKGMTKAEKENFLKVTLLHELEHHRQEIESDYTGSNPREWSFFIQSAIEKQAEAYKLIDGLKKSAGLNLDDDISNIRFDRMGDLMRDGISDKAYNKLTDNLDY